MVSGFTRTVNYGIRPIGAVTGGWLGAAMGVRPALWIPTVGGLLGVVRVVLSPLWSFRELPAEVIEPVAVP